MTIKEPDNNNGYAKASNIEYTMFLQLTVLELDKKISFNDYMRKNEPNINKYSPT